MSSTARSLTPSQREVLRDHIVNLRQGRFSTDGDVITTEQDVRHLFAQVLPAELARARDEQRPLRLLFYAHGGLVGEGDGIAGALAQIPFWKANGVYPIFFIWETGLQEVLADALRKTLAGQRGLGDVFREAQARLIESVARPAGLRVWGSMKLSARAASQADGGAHLVATLAGKFVSDHADAIQVHACGHSAGAIFQAHFLPVLIGEGATLQSLHLLAPAVTLPTFASTIMPLAGQGIASTTMFTMRREFEREDTAGPYPKSLLYLVHHSFEDPDETGILGLEENLTADPAVAQFFASAGQEIVYSVSEPGASPRHATHAIRHGDFDNDAPTMESACRRILGADDAAAIVPFPRTRTRRFDPLEQLAQELAMADRDTRAGSVLAPGAGTGFGVANALGGAAADTPLPAGPAATPGAGTTPLPPGSGGRRRALALCVGIDAYPEPDTLLGCVNDSRDWEQWFREMPCDVTSLHNGQATRAAITTALAEHVARLGAGDLLLFQYSGHGVQFPDQSGDELDNKDEALCPVDMMTAGFIRDDEIREILNHVPAGALVVSFIDCCHSGSIVRMLRALDATPPASRARAIVPTAEMVRVHRRTRVAGRASIPLVRRDVLFAACRDDQVAFETGGHGDYTQAIIPLLRQRSPGVTNAQLQGLIQQRFGADAKQNPKLDCDADAEQRAFLQP